MMPMLFPNFGGSLGGGGGGGGDEGALSSFASDLATRPWTSVSTWPSHSHSGGKTYSTYIAETPGQTPKIKVYDHATETEETYVIDTSPLTDDDHGIASHCLLSDGRIAVFYGSHNTDQQWSLSGASGGAPDPTTWTRQTPISGEITYPKPVNIPDGSGGGTLYLFTREDETDLQLKVRVAAYTSGGAVSFGAATALVDLNGRVYAGEVRATDATSSADIELMAAAADSGDTVRRHVYYFKYITATGAVENIDGSTSTGSGSLPINKTLADSDYREVDTGTNDSGIPSWCRDANGDLHVLYGDDSTSVGQAHDIKHNIYSGGSWGTATTPFTVINVSAGPYPNHFCIVPGGTGDDVEGWYPSGNTGSFSSIGGDSMARKVHQSGSWGSEEIIHTGVNGRALAAPTAVVDADADFRVAFTEVTQSVTGTDREELERYGHGDSGFVQWPDLTDDLLYRVSLLALFNESDGATAAPDESHWSPFHPMTFNGDAEVDTAVPFEGTASLRCSGAGSVRVPKSDLEFRLDPEDTIEAWVRFNTLTGNQIFLSPRPDGQANGYMLYYDHSIGKLHLTLYGGGSGNALDITGTTTLSTGTDYYITVQRLADDTVELRLGTTGATALEASGTPSKALTAGGDLYLGRYIGSSSILDGWIKARHTKGGLRDVSNVPTDEFATT